MFHNLSSMKLSWFNSNIHIFVPDGWRTQGNGYRSVKLTGGSLLWHGNHQACVTQGQMLESQWGLCRKFNMYLVVTSKLFSWKKFCFVYKEMVLILKITLFLYLTICWYTLFKYLIFCLLDLSLSHTHTKDWQGTTNPNLIGILTTFLYIFNLSSS